MSPIVKVLVDIFYNGLEYFDVYYSEYRAFVVDREDPNKEGRLRLIVPGIIDEPTEAWIHSVGAYAGRNYGMKFIPPVGSLVWVTFENGNPNKPLWKHGYFGENEIPDNLSHPDQHWILTPSGHLIEFNETDQDYIKVTHGSTEDTVILNPHGISVVSEKISLGSLNGSDQPSAMGKTLTDLLGEYIDDTIRAIDQVRSANSNISSSFTTIGSPTNWSSAASGGGAIASQAIVLSAQINQINNSLSVINNSLNGIKERLPNIHSKKVSLDYE